jgi:hypothetical protein
VIIEKCSWCRERYRIRFSFFDLFRRSQWFIITEVVCPECEKTQFKDLDLENDRRKDTIKVLHP